MVTQPSWFPQGLNPNSPNVPSMPYLDASGSYGTTSVMVVPSCIHRLFLLIQNTSTTATIGINFTHAATIGAGSIIIGPSASPLITPPLILGLSSGLVTNEVVNLICSAASTLVTIKYFQQ